MSESNDVRPASGPVNAYEQFLRQELDEGRLVISTFKSPSVRASGKPLPEHAISLLTIRWWVEMFDGHAAYHLLRPARDTVELWEASAFYAPKSSGSPAPPAVGKVVARLQSNNPDDLLIAKRLIYAVWAARIPYQVPGELNAEGALGQSDWEEIDEHLLRERGRVDWRNAADPHDLLKTSDELGLFPQCSGEKARRCRANCPMGRGHFIFIDPARGLWCCGYCKINGNSDDLRAAVSAARQARRPS